MAIWVVMLLIILGSLVMVAVIFYVSYKQEWGCASHQRLKREKEDDIEANFDIGVSLPIKTFNDPTRSDRLSPSTLDGTGADLDDGKLQRTGDRSENTQSTSETDSRLCHLAMIPRCVLCSKNFEIGGNVTHSNNPACHHEFHETCLTKHWAKQRKTLTSKKNSQEFTCPVCKKPYISADVSPTQHVSTFISGHNSDVSVSPLDE